MLRMVARPGSPVPLAPLAALAALALAACGGDDASSAPPARTSPELAEAEAVFPAGQIVFLDDRDASPVWVTRDARGVHALGGPEGEPAPIPPGRQETPPVSLRANDDGSIWVCYDDGVVRYDGSRWSANVIRWSAIFQEDVGADVGCESIDGAGRNDAWVTLDAEVRTSRLDGYPMCHFDGSRWTCEAFQEPLALFVRTEDHSWFVERGTPDRLRAIDTTNMGRPRTVEIGSEVETVAALTPVAGAERVLVRPASAMARAQLVSPDGFRRAAPAPGPTYAAGPDDLYTVRVEERVVERCVDDVCRMETDWTQLVVLRLTGGVESEVAHRTFLARGGLAVRLFGSEGALYVVVDDEEWFRVPTSG